MSRTESGRRRLVGRVAAILAAAVLPLACATPADAQAQAVRGAHPCSQMSVALQPACYAARAAGNVMDFATGAAGDVAGGVVGGIGESALSALTGFVVDGASWFVRQIGHAVTSSTDVDVTAGWFT